MHRRLSAGFVLILLVMLSFSGLAQAQGQQDDAAAFCRVVVQRALDELAINCANLGPNQVCYGSGEVEAAFFGGPDEINFNSVGARAPLDRLAAISLGAYNPNVPGGSLGAVAVSASANLPNQPGQFVNMVMMGELTLMNLVSPVRALVFDSDPISVAIGVETAELLTMPPDFEGAASFVNIAPAGVPSQVVLTAQQGDSFQADAIHESGEYVRVFAQYETDFATRNTAWLAVEALAPGADLDALPVVGPNTQTPMQVFKFETGPEEICRQATGHMTLASPVGIETDILANAVATRLRSVGILRASGIINPGENTYNTLTELYSGRAHQVCIRESAFGPFVDPGQRSSLTAFTPVDVVVDGTRTIKLINPLQAAGLAVMPSEEGYFMLTDADGTGWLVPEAGRLTLVSELDDSVRYVLGTQAGGTLVFLTTDGQPVDEPVADLAGVMARVAQAYSQLVQDENITLAIWQRLLELHNDIYSEDGALFITFRCQGFPGVGPIPFQWAEFARDLIRALTERRMINVSDDVLRRILDLIQEIVRSDPSAIGGALLPPLR